VLSKSGQVTEVNNSLDSSQKQAVRLEKTAMTNVILYGLVPGYTVTHNGIVEEC
jgi:hypothetical protein